MEKINRLKVVLAEKEKTNKWLAETLGKDSSTVSKWCTNTAQPDLMTLTKIAEALEVLSGKRISTLPKKHNNFPL